MSNENDPARAVPRSRIRSWVLNQQTNYARLIVVKPRLLKEWLATIEQECENVERFLVGSGYTIVDDEQ